MKPLSSSLVCPTSGGGGVIRANRFNNELISFGFTHHLASFVDKKLREIEAKWKSIIKPEEIAIIIKILGALLRLYYTLSPC